MRRAALLLSLSALIPLAAHEGHVHGLAAGVLHPLTGFDHLLAMVAVGVLGARLAQDGQRGAWWQMPAAFVAAMAGGIALGSGGISLPLVETGIMLSVLVLGLLIASPKAAWSAIALPIVAAAGLLHGHAHGAELAGDAATISGILAATALLHAAGIAAALAIARFAKPVAVRWTGLGFAAASLALFAI